MTVCVNASRQRVCAREARALRQRHAASGQERAATARESSNARIHGASPRDCDGSVARTATASAWRRTPGKDAQSPPGPSPKVSIPNAGLNSRRRGYRGKAERHQSGHMQSVDTAWAQS
jgi:hypothetical protein